jgi:L-seryl-tRNA(Ser) seleniumtransferase
VTVGVRATGQARSSRPGTIYDRWGVRPVINANATLTALGGSLMPEVVSSAMVEASKAFVDMFELQEAVSRRIAELTRNEAALVVSGASAGILVSALAAMTGQDMNAVAVLLEHGAGRLPRTEFIMHRSHRIAYDNVIRLAGGGVVEIGNAMQTFDWELEGAITDRTAAIVYVAGVHLAAAALPLAKVTGIAAAHEIPVIVDAAAQLPPRENLWRFAEEGADLVLFSGGKELRGPQSSGLILGRAKWIEACRLHAAPLQRFGRPAKVSKEDIVGLAVALEWWMEQDLDAVSRRVEATTAWWIDELSTVPGVSARRDYPGQAGRPSPRALIEWGETIRLSAREVATALRSGDPSVDVDVTGDRGVLLAADLLEPGDAEIVASRLRQVLETGAGGDR